MGKKYTWKPDTPFNDLPLLPPDNFSEELISNDLIRKAGEALAELRGYTKTLPPSLDQLLSPIYLEESLFSSKIENINTTLESVLEEQLSDNESDDDADRKVLNYQDAISWGWSKVVSEEPITQRLIEGLHSRLLPNERNSFRNIQNKIVNDASGDVRYTPPSHSEIGRLLSDWEDFVNTSNMDPIISTSIAHYQFEAIHPFVDGNGRVGRMLMILQLIKDGIMHGPSIQISRYINENRDEYYNLLLSVTENEDWVSFVEFLLKGFKVEADNTRNMLIKLDKELRSVSEFLQDRAPKVYSNKLVETVFSYPIINPTTLADKIDVHYQTASKYLKELESLNLLHSQKRGRKKLYINKKVFDIINKST